MGRSVTGFDMGREKKGRSVTGLLMGRLDRWLAIENENNGKNGGADELWWWRSVLGGSVLGGDDLGSARVRRSHRCWGATISPVVRSTLQLLLRCILAVSLYSLFFLSLSLFACLSPEMVWSENRNIKWFPGQSLYFYGQMKCISRNSIFHAQPNTRFYGKWFPKMVWSQNKRTLSL